MTRELGRNGLAQEAQGRFHVAGGATRVRLLEATFPLRELLLAHVHPPRTALPHRVQVGRETSHSGLFLAGHRVPRRVHPIRKSLSFFTIPLPLAYQPVQIGEESRVSNG